MFGTMTSRYDSGTVLENMMATWTDEQRALFENDWNDDTWLFQMGRGEKRAHEEVDDGAGPSDEQYLWSIRE